MCWPGNSKQLGPPQLNAAPKTQPGIWTATGSLCGPKVTALGAQWVTDIPDSLISAGLWPWWTQSGTPRLRDGAPSLPMSSGPSQLEDPNLFKNISGLPVLGN